MRAATVAVTIRRFVALAAVVMGLLAPVGVASPAGSAARAVTVSPGGAQLLGPTVATVATTGFPVGVGAGFCQAATVSVPVTLGRPSPVTVTASWSTLVVPSPGFDQASPGDDYVAASGTVTFAPGDVSETITLSLRPDVLDEPNEIVVVTVHRPTGAQMGGFWGLGFGFLRDDDPTPIVVGGSASIVEGDGGTTTLAIPVTLSAASARTVSAQWTTAIVAGAPGNQVSSDDVVAASGTVSFAPGQVAATVEVEVVGDAAAEADEYLVVALSSPTNAVLGGFWGLAFGGILDDDTPPPD